MDVQQVAAREGKVLSWIGGPSAEPSGSEPTAEARPAARSEPFQAPQATEAERRQLTVLFCDLVGSTSLAADMDPEDWRETVRGYQTAAAGVVARFGGHVAQYLGDGLLVYFGWPQAHEDDAERAVRAGLGIVGAVAGLSHEGRPELAVRVGIHTGPVVVGEMGAGERREMLALGDTTNIAARLQAVAEPGTVVMSKATLRLVAGVFVVHDLGETELKGISEPVQTYQVDRPSGVRSRLDVAAATGLTPFVGRDQEQMLLHDRFAQVLEGAGQAVLVCGEAGIGKSRLMQAFRERMAERPHTWLECRCSPYTQDSSLYPVLELLHQALGFHPEDGPEVKLERLERGLRNAEFELDRTLPLVAAFLSVRLPDRIQVPVLSPEAQRKRTLELLVEWLLRLGRQQPVVLLMDDLHWMDPSTIELLSRILDQLARAQVLLVLTFRPDFEPPWPPRSNITPLLLSRLTRAQVGDLVRKAARERDLAEPWVEEIVRRSDGVPLFAEELTRAVLETHSQLPQDGVLPELEIPETLQDSLMARLDTLGPVKELAQLGAVLGREFSYDLLLSVSPLNDAELRSVLATAVREELFYQRGIPPEATYVFRHALLRDVAHQSLLRTTRRRYNARIADALVRQMPEVASARPELVAHHLTEGGEIEKAIGYWQRAGERATGRMANAEASLHLQKGLELVEQLPPGSERDQRELRLQIALGAPLMALKGYSSTECEQVYARARELCQRLGNVPGICQSLFGLAAYHYARGQLRTSAEVSSQLLEIAGSSPEESHRILAHSALGMSLFDQGDLLRAIENLERAVELYKPARDHALAAAYGWDPDVVSRSLLARALAQVGQLDRALERCREAIDRGRESRYAHSLALATLYAALVHQIRGEVDLARQRAEESCAIAEEQALVVPLGASTAFHGWALAAQGSGEGLGELQAGLAQLAPTGFQLGAPLFLGLLAEAQRFLGHGDDVVGTLDAALGLAAANDNRFWDAELLRIKGEQLLEDPSRVEEGENLLQQAVELSRSRQWRTFELRAATSLARLWQQRGGRAEARDLLRPVYDGFTEGFDTRDLKDAKALLAELA